MKKRGLVLALCVLLWALLLLPFFAGAPAAHPATDDFTFAAYTHPTWLETGSVLHVIKDAFSYALRTWRDWQGTITGVIGMALGPAAFSIDHYGVHAALLLALHLLAMLVFLRHFLHKRLGLPLSLYLPLSLFVSAAQLIFLPDMVEGIYWYNGAWFYTGAQAVALLTLTFADVYSESHARRAAQVTAGACLSVVLFALGMDNYITAMMTAAALLMMSLSRLYISTRDFQMSTGRVEWTQDGQSHIVRQGRTVGSTPKEARREARRTALLLIPLCAGLLISVFAPGNAVRMAADGAHRGGIGYAVLSCLLSADAALGYLWRFATTTPVLLMLLLMTPLLLRALDRCAPETFVLCPPIIATIAGFYLILCAMIVPHMYASGYAGSGRVVNMYHSYVLLALPIAYTMVLARLKAKTRACVRRAYPAFAALSAVLLVLCVRGGQWSDYVKLVRDQADGTQAAYVQQVAREYALCREAGPQDDVLLPAWTVQTVTGKPTATEDSSFWTNQAMADYFGVKSVAVQAQGE